MSNSVPWGDRKCVICHEETSTMSRDTGYIELQLRLPCNHVVGSGCIVAHFKEKNFCPVCRREFFPAQPPQYPEHAIMEEPADEHHHEIEERGNEEEEVQNRQAVVNRLCEEYSNRLPLTNGYRIGVFSQKLAEDYASRAMWTHHSAEVVAAACVFLACTFVGRVTSNDGLVGAAALNLAQATIDLSIIDVAQATIDLSIIDEMFGDGGGVQSTIEAFLESLPHTR